MNGGDFLDVAETLVHLRMVRNRADYDVDRPLNQPVAMTQFQAATDIIQILEQAVAEPTIRTRITDPMKIYERDVLREVTWHA